MDIETVLGLLFILGLLGAGIQRMVDESRKRRLLADSSEAPQPERDSSRKIH